MKSFSEYFLQNNYDAFKIDKVTNGNLLYFTMMYVYYKEDWKTNIPELNTVKYQTLAYKVMIAYRKNFYHTQTHAADVVQNLYMVIREKGIDKLCDIGPIDFFTTLLSGAAHDMDHPGHNNFYEIKSASKLAILYNDVSVLENHHVASLFFLLENI